MKKSLILFFLVCLYAGAQETGYLVRNYSSKEYNGFNQVWSAVQDSNGIMYFGTSSDIITFDGKKWGSIRVKKGMPIRTLQIKDGRIYVGSDADFGYIDYKSDKQPHYVSFLPELKKEDLGFTDIWKIHIWNNKLVFQSYERIFIYDGKRFTRIDPKTSFALSFVSQGRLFVRQRQIGLMEVNADGTLRLVKGGEFFKNVPVIAFIYDKAYDGFVLAGSEHGVMFYDEKTGTTRILDKQRNNVLLDQFPLTLTRYKEEGWFMTSRAGFFVLNNDFSIRTVFNKQTGINDDVVTGTYFSRDGNLWLTLNNGISMVEWDSDGFYLTEKSGYKGGVEDILLDNGMYYLCTSYNVYKLPYNEVAGGSFRFESIESEITEYWDLERVAGKLFAASTVGLFEIKNNRAQKFSPHWTRYLLKLNDSLPLMIALQKNCFSVFDVNAVPMLKKEYFFPGEEFNHGLLLRDGRNYVLWAVTPGGKLFRFRLTENYELTETRIYGERNGYIGTYQNVYAANGTVFLPAPSRACVYNAASDKDSNSVCFSSGGRIPIDYTKEIVISNNFNGRLFDGKTYQIFLQKQRNGTYRHRLFSLRQDINEFTCYVTDDSLRTWFFSPEYIVLQKVVREKPLYRKFPVNITYFRAGKDSSNIFYGTPSVTEFTYGNNSIQFEYSAAFFTEPSLTNYRVRLLGATDSAWTAWTTANKKEYTNLHEGEYEFCVQAVNAFADVCSSKSFHFTVLPPWYRTGWAYAGYAIALALIVFSAVRIGNYRLQQSKIKLEKLVNERTHELQEKKKEITDSIKYALRIQNAILPPDTYFKRLLPDSFTFYRPKDIVSGDFYWVEEIRGKVLFAAVDCTGHGVPGAMMSVIGLRLLNSAVNDRRLDVPADILRFLDHGVHDTLRQGDAGSGVKDGMDLALCTWDKAAGVLEYAGVFNSLWLVRKNIASTWRIKNSKEVLFGGHLLEIKPDKMPIGNNAEQKADSYTNHYIKLLPGDCVYIYSDGYADQFGGPNGKKFKYNRLKELIVANAHLSMEEQHRLLAETFDQWKSDSDQIDDVLVMGIRV